MYRHNFNQIQTFRLEWKVDLSKTMMARNGVQENPRGLARDHGTLGHRHSTGTGPCIKSRTRLRQSGRMALVFRICSRGSAQVLEELRQTKNRSSEPHSNKNDTSPCLPSTIHEICSQSMHIAFVKRCNVSKKCNNF